MERLDLKMDGSFVALLHLKKASWACVLSQLVVSTIVLFCFVIFPPSNTISVSCGWLAIIASLTPVFYSIYSRYFPVLFSCISTFNMAPIWFLYKDSILIGSDTYIYSSPSLKLEALLYAVLFQIFVNLLYVGSRRLGMSYVNGIFSFINKVRLSNSFFIWLSFLTFSLPILAFYLYYDSFDILWLAITGGRSGGGSSGGLLIQESIGDASSYMIPINSVWQLTPLFGVIGFTSSKRKFKIFPILSLILGILVVFAFFLSGSRGTMMFVAAPVLFFFVYFNWHKGLKFWIPATFLFLASFAVMELQVRFRGGLLEVIADPIRAARMEGFSSPTTLDPTKANQENNMYLFCLILEGVPRKYEYEGFNDFFATLVNPVPRAIWPDKPVLRGAREVLYQPGYILDGPIYMGTTSLTYSVVGEAYLAKGIIGLLVYSMVYAIFIFIFDGVIIYALQGRILAVGLLAMSMFLSFWGYRSFFALVTFIYPLVLLILFLWVTKKVRGNTT